MKRFSVVLLVLLLFSAASLVTACTWIKPPYQAAFTCELTVKMEGDPVQVASIIERDRILMSHPGMRQKMLPIAFGPDDTLFMGGRYLFKTQAQAADYEDFVLNRYELDGMLFLNRPEFLDHDCRHWETIGAHDFADFTTNQVVLRTERWVVPQANWTPLLYAYWPLVRETAEARGLTAVWLLYSHRDRYVQLVYFADRVAPPDPSAPDFASLGALEGAPPLGALFANQTSWQQDMDKTQWVFTIWQPYKPGDTGDPAIFPYSPPFPGLFCGDNLCSVNGGETHDSCMQDCPAQCGDAICQPQLDEDALNCPSDCRVPSSPIQAAGWIDDVAITLQHSTDRHPVVANRCEQPATGESLASFMPPADGKNAQMPWTP